MPAPSIATSYDGGFEAVVVDTGAVSFSVLPELGGKIASLHDQRSGREWLWRHPRLPYRQVAPESSYVEAADTGGWDECFPTVDRCAYPEPPWRGAALPDHGELWSQPVALDVSTTAEQLVLDALWHGRVLPYRFRRRITAQSGSGLLRCEYRVDNLGAHPLRHSYCAHPLIAVEPGMRLRVPDAARFHISVAQPAAIVRRDELLRFPFEVALGEHTMGLDVLPPRDAGIALKVWSEPLAEAWAALRAPDGELHLRWGGGEWSQLALWFNLGALGMDGGAAYYNLGFEPCIGAQDSLAAAVASGLAASVPAGGSQSWWIEVELSV